jgi:hypothetical protein
MLPSMPTRARPALIGCALLASAVTSRVTIADPDVPDQAKLAQNPIANVISVPLQDNANLNAGTERGTQNVLNVEPVIPLSINDSWNIVTRTILPVISDSAAVRGGGRTYGVGDTLFTAFLSPAHSGGWIWGVGPAVQAPTHSDRALGNDDWGLGPSFVVLHLDKGSPWVSGVLLNNVWSVGGSHSHAYNNGLMQPFVNYNLSKGWYLVSSPIVTVNWAAPGSKQWTVPVGGGVGKIVHVGHVPVNLQLSGYYNLATPTYGANWQIRTQVQLLFPK